MFTNSGMMPFVPYFIGEEQVPWNPPRTASIQRCVRAGGKHNDLDAIGRSPRHLSFFEMLGNFSFGDYFKADAIRWAWSSPPRSSASTVTGSGSRATSRHEAVGLWIDEIGFPQARIQRLDKDNFWEWRHGPVRSQLGAVLGLRRPGGSRRRTGQSEAEHRFVEFWNLVFQQYFRQPDGSLEPLRHRNIDTGPASSACWPPPIDVPDVFATDELRELVPPPKASPASGSATATSPTSPSSCWPTMPAR